MRWSAASTPHSKLEVYAEWVSALERAHVIRLLDPTLGRSGLIKGERIIGVLRELIGDCDIAELPMSYTAVATDIESGEEVWLREGRLFDAIRASMATPLVFTPFKHGERTLLDGALVNPLPVAPTLDDGTDLTIAVNLGGPAELAPGAAAARAGERRQCLRQAHRRLRRGAASRPRVGRESRAACWTSPSCPCRRCTTPSRG